MNKSSLPQSDFQNSLVKLGAGFFGTIAAYFLLPKTLKFVLRRFAFGVITEVVMVVLAGLLSEKAVEKLSRD